MKSNFDEIIDRRNTNSVKYDSVAGFGKSERIIPMWIADMDFKVPECVTEVLAKSVRHSVYGYSEVTKDGAYFAALQNWFSHRFGLKAEPEWLIKTPGVVFAMCTAVKAFTEKGDAVLIQRPVYPPFTKSAEANGRHVVVNPLVYEDGRYSIDFADFEDKIAKNNVKLFILCSPHNPVGRVWTKDELGQMGEICVKRNVLVLSDEVHCDFVYGGNRHTAFATISEDFLANSITCTSPGKTFNISGLQVSNIFIAEPDLRQKFCNEAGKTGYGRLNTMALAACQAAYENGGEWLGELLVYLQQNYNYAKYFINTNMPKARLAELQGTYLLWLDLNAYGFSQAELDKTIIEKAGLLISNGDTFGEEGKGFIRINMACPLSTLEKALGQLATALK